MGGKACVKARAKTHDISFANMSTHLLRYMERERSFDLILFARFELIEL